eukprot:2097257-Rhodomonas_salina.9
MARKTDASILSSAAGISGGSGTCELHLEVDGARAVLLSLRFQARSVSLETLDLLFLLVARSGGPEKRRDEE